MKNFQSSRMIHPKNPLLMCQYKKNNNKSQLKQTRLKTNHLRNTINGIKTPT